MNKKIIISIVALVVIIAGYLLFFQQTPILNEFDGSVSSINAIWSAKGVDITSEGVLFSDELNNLSVAELTSIKTNILNLKNSFNDQKSISFADVHIALANLQITEKKLEEKASFMDSVSGDFDSMCPYYENYKTVKENSELVLSEAQDFSNILNSFISNYPTEAEKSNLTNLRPNTNALQDAIDTQRDALVTLDFFCGGDSYPEF